MNKTAIPIEERLIIALDFPSAEAAKDLVNRLGDNARFYKIGLELFLSASGFALLDWLVGRGKKVFLDLKFFDIPQTVGAAIAQLRDCGATFTSVHGNEKMLAAAVANKGMDLKVLAVTMLTSVDDADLNDLGFPDAVNVQQLVLSRARRALACGCDGVVSSGLEAPILRDSLDGQFTIVTPGIRPVHNDDDQKRTVDVAEAFINGADYIVVGRPIRLADNPAAQVESILATIARQFA